MGEAGWNSKRFLNAGIWTCYPWTNNVFLRGLFFFSPISPFSLTSYFTRSYPIHELTFCYLSSLPILFFILIYRLQLGCHFSRPFPILIIFPFPFAFILFFYCYICVAFSSKSLFSLHSIYAPFTSADCGSKVLRFLPTWSFQYEANFRE